MALSYSTGGIAMRQSSFTVLPRYGSRGAHQLQSNTSQSEWNHVLSLLTYQDLRISKQVTVIAQCVAVSRETLYKQTGVCGLRLAFLLPCTETGIVKSLSGILVKVYTTCSCIDKSTLGPHSVCMCLCGSENKQRLFPYTALTDWFL